MSCPAIIICAAYGGNNCTSNQRSERASNLHVNYSWQMMPPSPTAPCPSATALSNIQSQSAELMNCVCAHTQGSQYMRSGSGAGAATRASIIHAARKIYANRMRIAGIIITVRPNWQRGIDSIFILANFMLNMPPFAFNS